MPENKKPSATDASSKTESKQAIDKLTEKMAEQNRADKKNSNGKTTTKKTQPVSKPVNTSQSKVSKLAIVAILIAIAAPAGLYLWQQQQNQQLSQQIITRVSQDNVTSLANIQSQVQQALEQQRTEFSQQIAQVKAQTLSANKEKINQLNQMVNSLEQRVKQRQPSDWLLHESEYLIRVAARTLWLAHDTKAAIGLLTDADNRLAELNDPSYLPIRKLIHQDISSLESLPTLDTDEIILNLMAMNKQVEHLPLAINHIDNSSNQKENLELTDNLDDWQNNLAKTWQKFLDDFIRVRQRSGSIEPLMSPQQQANLKQNLSLKIQLALWAASERKEAIYLKTLNDIEQWLTEYFDVNDALNQNVMVSIATLKQQRVNYQYPSDLSSLPAIRAVLSKSVSPLPESDNSTTEETDQDKTVNEDQL